MLLGINSFGYFSKRGEVAGVATTSYFLPALRKEVSDVCNVIHEFKFQGSALGILYRYVMPDVMCQEYGFWKDFK